MAWLTNVQAITYHHLVSAPWPEAWAKQGYFQHPGWKPGRAGEIKTIDRCYTDTNSNLSAIAFSTLARSLGEAGEIEPETEGILMENGIDATDFTESVSDGS